MFIMKNEDNIAKASEYTASDNSADNCTGVLANLYKELRHQKHTEIVSHC